MSHPNAVTTAPCGTDQFANLPMNMCGIPPKKRKCDFQMTGNQLVTLISPTEIVLKLPQNTSASFPIWGLIQASQAEGVWNVTPYKIDIRIVPLNAFKPEVSEPSDQVAEHQQRSGSSFFIVRESVPNWGSIFYDPVQESTFDQQYQIGKTQICDQFLLGCCSLDLRCPLHHTPFPFHWQLRRRARYQWVSVSQSAQIHLEKLYCNTDSDEAILNLLDNVFTLNFDSMTVCDSDNYDEVRRFSNTTKSDCNPHFPTVWKMYWRNDYDLFVEYDESISRQLEDAIQNRALKYTFTQTGRQYEVDFSNLNQKNIATGFIREIRRRPVFRFLPALQPHLKTLSPNVFPGHGEAQPQVCLADPLEEFTCWYPPVWRPGPTEEEFTKIEVKLYEKAYLKVYELFHKTLSEADVEIVNIYQIQNTFQWDKYRRQKEYMLAKCGENKECTIERHLFHGTTTDAVDRICKNNFDPRVSGKNGSVYGRGSYFAQNASYSNDFAKPTKDGFQYMFLAKVLVGKKDTGKSGYNRPPPLLPENPKSDLYDSCVNNPTDPTIFVIFDSCQCYPYYLIKYRVMSDVVNISEWNM
ncbi:protein mono-ADP-ribosyltransferase TIPARP-like [Acipenser ruthenus]|uniref:protein mono-ADP-ribosyltransferase TIPARP-like n=1 Tax=Acipenser ruthenus TaxID=7906 RepID=UPI00274134E5|nr:protein mono-ADP-ribosyltransferase TIPARP-like [Acipenser ruthenus]